MDISVIIPAFNRPQALERTLQGLAKQTVPAERFEVLVVDDGSTDEGIQALAHRQWPYPLQVLRQSRSGPGAARNRGVQESHGGLLVFLDADMIPDADLIQAYSAAHATQSRAVLVGRQQPWSPAFTSRFDQIFNYVAIGDLGSSPRICEFYHLASGNFAVARETLALLNGFDEQLLMCEDTDLGYRVLLQGIALRYAPAAVGYHNHPKTLAELCDWQHASARWTAHLIHKHPQIIGQLPVYREVEPIFLGQDSARLVLRKVARRVLAAPPALALLEVAASLFERISPIPALLRSLYFKILTSHRLRGFRQGLADLQRQATDGN